MKNMIRSLLALGLLVASQAAAKAEEILLQSVQSGMYVTVVNGTLAAASPDRRGASRFDTVRLEGNRMALRDMRSNTYVRAGVGQGTFLAAGSPHIRGWETFEVMGVDGRDVALRSAQNGKFVRAGVGSRSHLAAVSDRAAGWETFRFVDVRDARPGNNAGSNAGNRQPGSNHGGNRGGLDTDDLFGNYRITHIAADNGFLVQLGDRIAARAQLTVDGRGTVRATIGCNSLSADISVRNGRVRPEGGVISTKVACPGRGQAAAERGLSYALTNSRFVEREGRTVTFKAANGAELMKISRR